MAHSYGLRFLCFAVSDFIFLVGKYRKWDVYPVVKDL